MYIYIYIYIYVCMYYSEITVNALHHIALYTRNKDIKHLLARDRFHDCYDGSIVADPFPLLNK